MGKHSLDFQYHTVADKVYYPTVYALKGSMFNIYTTANYKFGPVRLYL